MKVLALALLLVALAIVPTRLEARDSVEVGGQTYTCENTCVVTYHNGQYTVRDCCGGRIYFRLNPP